MDNKLKVIYDFKSCPEDCTLENIYNIMINSGIILWDSQLGGIEPKIIDSNDLSLYDVGFISKEIFEEKFGGIMNED